MVSVPGDVHEWNRLWRFERIGTRIRKVFAGHAPCISRPREDQVTEAQTDTSGRPMPTTLGWHRGQVDGHEYFGKCGGGPGYSSNIRIYPKEGIGTVYLSNKTEVSEGPINDLSDKLDIEFMTNRRGQQLQAIM
jgi:D-alanyl-D-alanine carboxypeptidase